MYMCRRLNIILKEYEVISIVISGLCEDLITKEIGGFKKTYLHLLQFIM